MVKFGKVSKNLCKIISKSLKLCLRSLKNIFVEKYFRIGSKIPLTLVFRTFEFYDGHSKTLFTPLVDTLTDKTSYMLRVLLGDKVSNISCTRTFGIAISSFDVLISKTWKTSIHTPNNTKSVYKSLLYWIGIQNK